MTQAALVGLSTVGGGPGATGVGIITGPGGLGQYADGLIVSVVGDTIATHGPAPHIGAVVTTGSPDTFINHIPIARVGDQASCGCTILAGDNDAFIQ